MRIRFSESHNNCFDSHYKKHSHYAYCSFSRKQEGQMLNKCICESEISGWEYLSIPFGALTDLSNWGYRKLVWLSCLMGIV